MADAPPANGANGAPPVTDHRPVPRPALPRGLQTWLMVGLAVGMVAIILFTGRPDAPASRSPSGGKASSPASPDRVRDYQDRLRAIEAQAGLDDARAATLAANAQALPTPDAGPARTEDPLVAEKRRRNYESLFATNVVISRRPASERPDVPAAANPITKTTDAERTPPSIDEIADAAIRATARARGTMPDGPPSLPASTPAAVPQSLAGQLGRTTPAHTDPLVDGGPRHRILEGTLIDTVLTNRLESSGVAPVNCLVTDPVYSHRARVVLIPAGARLLGETKPVQAFGETRLAVAFHRVVMPDGSTYSLNQFIGLNQLGDAGLKDKVNQHYLSTFGAAAAVGLITGFAQYLSTAGLGQADGRGTVVVSGAADATSQAAMQVLNRFLNRLPTITIREGHRVRVYVTSDFELPAYPAAAESRF
mgnify:CR=1 FL=1